MAFSPPGSFTNDIFTFDNITNVFYHCHFYRLNLLKNAFNFLYISSAVFRAGALG